MHVLDKFGDESANVLDLDRVGLAGGSGPQRDDLIYDRLGLVLVLLEDLKKPLAAR